jgi:hypothetical protein
VCICIYIYIYMHTCVYIQRQRRRKHCYLIPYLRYLYLGLSCDNVTSSKSFNPLVPQLSYFSFIIAKKFFQKDLSCFLFFFPHFLKIVLSGATLFFLSLFILLLLCWGYIVAFTKGLTVYQIYHNALNMFVLFHSP